MGNYRCLLPLSFKEEGLSNLQLNRVLLQGYIRDVRKNRNNFKPAKLGISENYSSVLTITDCFYFLTSRIIGTPCRIERS